MPKFVSHWTTALTAVSVKINCEIPTRAKTSFQLLDCEQELRQTALSTFEDVVKSYLLVQHNIKQERGDQQLSIAEKLTAELVAPHLEQLWRLVSIRNTSDTMTAQKIRQYTENWKVQKYY